MLVIGLTGSIGMGKSTAAARFRALGAPVFDADAEVHRLYNGPIVEDIEAAFAGATRDGRVDRARLAALLVAEPQGFKKLEAIVHPAVRRGERTFLRACHDSGAKLAILEIPLLFESGGDRLVDATVVVSADAATQRRRVLARPGMTDEKLAALLARQLPDDEKRRRADFVVDGSGDVQRCNAQIDEIMVELRDRDARAFDAHWRRD